MPTNDRVTQKQHYEDLTRLGEGLGKSVADLDSKLGGKIDAVLAAVIENRERGTGQYAEVGAAIQVLKDLRDKPGGIMDRLSSMDIAGGRLGCPADTIAELKVSD